MKKSTIRRTCSIADARNNLPRIVHEAEKGKATKLTRRGRPVAVLISATDYERLVEDRPDFWKAYLALRSRYVGVSLDVDEFLEGIRDRSPGRRVTW